MAGRSRTKAPRVVIVTRETEYELLLARHGTRAQAAFFLSSRGQTIDFLTLRHERFHAALHRVIGAIPVDWRRNRIARRDLSRFLFEPDDTIVVVGRDGLVANVAKYLEGQPVLGINPEPEENVGVLVPFPVEAIDDLLHLAVQGRATIQSRTMVRARLRDGQVLLALNEIFVGHRSHQSARYRLNIGDAEENQSSSGLIVTTGTGATGWALSIQQQHRAVIDLPAPEERRLTYLVREAYPGITTGTDLAVGSVEGDVSLRITSHMNDDGVLFGDGVEEDALRFEWGEEATIDLADHGLQLITD